MQQMNYTYMNEKVITLIPEVNILMIFTETYLKGAYIIELEKIADERGFFARVWDKHEFEERGLNSDLVQCNVSFSNKKGTLRGMHYQIFPQEEVKLVRCTKGKIFDVIIDLRKNSNTYKKWFSKETSEDSHQMIYIPEGFAHGFQTLEDNTEVYYQVSAEYDSKLERGIRWNDPIFSISWPLEVSIMSQRDKNFPLFTD